MKGKLKDPGYTTLMGAPPKVQPIFLLALLRESLDTLYSWVRHLKYSLCLFAVTTASLGYTALMGAPPKVQPISDICKLYQRNNNNHIGPRKTLEVSP